MDLVKCCELMVERPAAGVTSDTAATDRDTNVFMSRYTCSPRRPIQQRTTAEFRCVHFSFLSSA